VRTLRSRPSRPAILHAEPVRSPGAPLVSLRDDASANLVPDTTATGKGPGDGSVRGRRRTSSLTVTHTHTPPALPPRKSRPGGTSVPAGTVRGSARRAGVRVD